MLIIGALIGLIVGFILGFTTYAFIVKRAAEKGRVFTIDKNGKWLPFEPQPINHSDLVIRDGSGEIP